MKKLLTLCMLFALLALPGLASAAGSWGTPVYNDIGSSAIMRTFTITATADAANGSVPDYTMPAAMLSFCKGYYLYYLETKPGAAAAAPTDNYTITVIDALGYDAMGGATSANRSATLAQKTAPASVYHPFDGSAMTIKVSGNVVNSATITVKFVLSK